ncbi:MAG: cobyrinic acid a,c-diamide synthase [Gallionellaceae bacterium CG11_big_fil_rev_8_21_14_0_20_60_62]|nr:MAG: cobyrinic acid a,c-diamide synthase [Gallionellaceae bacterium CG11_big_fil_rev_8_21_14_0_20_60_62]
MSVRHCPAVLISAPASGQGKTTVTAALAAYHRSQGRRVRVFKTGPDFIDPTILEQASGYPVYQLDLWMGGEPDCRAKLYRAAGEADLILVEGVMGLFDGKLSSADLAKQFGIPVLAVIDAGAMAQTFAALAFGLSQLDASLPFFGVVANRVAGTRHAEMLTEHLPAGIKFYGALPRAAEINLPERHLGLLQAGELPDIRQRIDHAAELWAEHAYTGLPPVVAFAPVESAAMARKLQGVKIAVARDAAFSFLYQANLDVLSELGAQLSFFSPLEDQALPEADSLYLPGGYPELHLSKLARNTAMLSAIRAHHAAGKPILAECGGMLYTLQTLTDAQGQSEKLLGLIEGAAQMQPRLSALALQSVKLQQGTLRGHTFHYSKLESRLVPSVRGTCPNGGASSEAVYQRQRLTASYIHFYFPFNPDAAAQLFLP